MKLQEIRRIIREALEMQDAQLGIEELISGQAQAVRFNSNIVQRAEREVSQDNTTQEVSGQVEISWKTSLGRYILDAQISATSEYQEGSMGDYDTPGTSSSISLHSPLLTSVQVITPDGSEIQIHDGDTIASLEEFLSREFLS